MTRPNPPKKKGQGRPATPAARRMQQAPAPFEKRKKTVGGPKERPASFTDTRVTAKNNFLLARQRRQEEREEREGSFLKKRLPATSLSPREAAKDLEEALQKIRHPTPRIRVTGLVHLSSSLSRLLAAPLCAHIESSSSQFSSLLNPLLPTLLPALLGSGLSERDPAARTAVRASWASLLSLVAPLRARPGRRGLGRRGTGGGATAVGGETGHGDEPWDGETEARQEGDSQILCAHRKRIAILLQNGLTALDPDTRLDTLRLIDTARRLCPSLLVGEEELPFSIINVLTCGTATLPAFTSLALPLLLHLLPPHLPSLPRVPFLSSAFSSPRFSASTAAGTNALSARKDAIWTALSPPQQARVKQLAALFNKTCKLWLQLIEDLKATCRGRPASLALSALHAGGSKETDGQKHRLQKAGKDNLSDLLLHLFNCLRLLYLLLLGTRQLLPDERVARMVESEEAERTEGGSASLATNCDVHGNPARRLSSLQSEKNCLLVVLLLQLSESASLKPQDESGSKGTLTHNQSGDLFFFFVRHVLSSLSFLLSFSLPADTPAASASCSALLQALRLGLASLTFRLASFPLSPLLTNTGEVFASGSAGALWAFSPLRTAAGDRDASQSIRGASVKKRGRESEKACDGDSASEVDGLPTLLLPPAFTSLFLSCYLTALLFLLHLARQMRTGLESVQAELRGQGPRAKSAHKKVAKENIFLLITRTGNAAFCVPLELGPSAHSLRVEGDGVVGSPGPIAGGQRGDFLESAPRACLSHFAFFSFSRRTVFLTDLILQACTAFFAPLVSGLQAEVDRFTSRAGGGAEASVSLSRRLDVSSSAPTFFSLILSSLFPSLGSHGSRGVSGKRKTLFAPALLHNCLEDLRRSAFFDELLRGEQEEQEGEDQRAEERKGEEGGAEDRGQRNEGKNEARGRAASHLVAAVLDTFSALEQTTWKRSRAREESSVSSPHSESVSPREQSHAASACVLGIETILVESVSLLVSLPLVSPYPHAAPEGRRRKPTEVVEAEEDHDEDEEEEDDDEEEEGDEEKEEGDEEEEEDEEEVSPVSPPEKNDDVEDEGSSQEKDACGKNAHSSSLPTNLDPGEDVSAFVGCEKRSKLAVCASPERVPDDGITQLSVTLLPLAFLLLGAAPTEIAAALPSVLSPLYRTFFAALEDPPFSVSGDSRLAQVLASCAAAGDGPSHARQQKKQRSSANLRDTGGGEETPGERQHGADNASPSAGGNRAPQQMKETGDSRQSPTKGDSEVTLGEEAKRAEETQKARAKGRAGTVENASGSANPRTRNWGVLVGQMYVKLCSTVAALSSGDDMRGERGERDVGEKRNERASEREESTPQRASVAHVHRAAEMANWIAQVMRHIALRRNEKFGRTETPLWTRALSLSVFRVEFLGLFRAFESSLLSLFFSPGGQAHPERHSETEACLFRRASLSRSSQLSPGRAPLFFHLPSACRSLPLSLLSLLDRRSLCDLLPQLLRTVVLPSRSTSPRVSSSPQSPSSSSPELLQATASSRASPPDACLPRISISASSRCEAEACQDLLEILLRSLTSCSFSDAQGASADADQASVRRAFQWLEKLLLSLLCSATKPFADSQEATRSVAKLAARPGSEVGQSVGETGCRGTAKAAGDDGRGASTPKRRKLDSDGQAAGEDRRADEAANREENGDVSVSPLEETLRHDEESSCSLSSSLPPCFFLPSHLPALLNVAAKVSTDILREGFLRFPSLFREPQRAAAREARSEGNLTGSAMLQNEGKREGATCCPRCTILETRIFPLLETVLQIAISGTSHPVASSSTSSSLSSVVASSVSSSASSLPEASLDARGCFSYAAFFGRLHAVTATLVFFRECLAEVGPSFLFLERRNSVWASSTRPSAFCLAAASPAKLSLQSAAYSFPQAATQDPELCPYTSALPVQRVTDGVAFHQTYYFLSQKYRYLVDSLAGGVDVGQAAETKVKTLTFTDWIAARPLLSPISSSLRLLLLFLQNPLFRALAAPLSPSCPSCSTSPPLAELACIPEERSLGTALGAETARLLFGCMYSLEVPALDWGNSEDNEAPGGDVKHGEETCSTAGETDDLSLDAVLNGPLGKPPADEDRKEGNSVSDSLAKASGHEAAAFLGLLIDLVCATACLCPCLSARERETSQDEGDAESLMLFTHFFRFFVFLLRALDMLLRDQLVGFPAACETRESDGSEAETRRGDEAEESGKPAPREKSDALGEPRGQGESRQTVEEWENGRERTGAEPASVMAVLDALLSEEKLKLESRKGNADEGQSAKQGKHMFTSATKHTSPDCETGRQTEREQRDGVEAGEAAQGRGEHLEILLTCLAIALGIHDRARTRLAETHFGARRAERMHWLGVYRKTKAEEQWRKRNAQLPLWRRHLATQGFDPERETGEGEARRLSRDQQGCLFFSSPVRNGEQVAGSGQAQTERGARPVLLSDDGDDDEDEALDALERKERENEEREWSVILCRDESGGQVVREISKELLHITLPRAAKMLSRQGGETRNARVLYFIRRHLMRLSVPPRSVLGERRTAEDKCQYQ
uniref:Uncharacterized protein n=1 Tax=Toxoplasma gondii (strain ATCC 50861 / VEG) TaxID=432359 RepID=A0A0F7VDQ7_TOXGV|nr:TPA: hypothetical protein BN1205_070125 [Toxoplasma gondii VEG]